MPTLCGSEVQFDICVVVLRVTMSVIFGEVLVISQTRKGRADKTMNSHNNAAKAGLASGLSIQ